MTFARFLSFFGLSLFVSLSALAGAGAATDNTEDLLAKLSNPEPSGVMLTADAGGTIFTGGLGKTNNPTFSLGARAGYLFSDGIALELSVGYSNDLDSIVTTNGVGSVQFDTNVYPVLAGVRYYFLTGPMPEAIARPYFEGGAGITFRSQAIVPNSLRNLTVSDPGTPGGNSTNPTLYLALGTDFSLVKNRLYLGADARYAFTFWTDADSTFAGALAQGSRAGDLFLLTANLTWVI